MWGNLITALIYISLMISYVECLLKYFLATCISSLEDILHILKSSLLLLLSCGGSLYILDAKLLHDIQFANIFSPVDFLFIQGIVSFDEQRLKFWCSPVYLFFFSFFAWAFSVISKKSLLNPMSWSFPPTLSSKNFIVLPLMLRSLINFKLILPYNVR